MKNYTIALGILSLTSCFIIGCARCVTVGGVTHDYPIVNGTGVEITVKDKETGDAARIKPMRCFAPAESFIVTYNNADYLYTIDLKYYIPAVRGRAVSGVSDASTKPLKLMPDHKMYVLDLTRWQPEGFPIVGVRIDQ